MANLLKNFFTDFEDINDYYTFLVDKTKRLEYVGITNEWLIDNFYLLVEHKTNIVHDKKYVEKDLKKYNRIFYCLRDIVTRNHYNISFKILVTELRDYQRQTKVTFSYPELTCVKNFLLFIYTKRLADLCKEEYHNLLNKEKVARIIESREEKELELSNFLSTDFSVQKDANYIFEINNQLKELGAKTNSLFKELNELLGKNNISLKEIINQEYQRNIDNDILISNIFGDLKEFFEFTEEDLFKKVSKTEKMLLEDEIYSKMTVESKRLYRNQLLKLSKKNHKDELSYLVGRKS